MLRFCRKSGAQETTTLIKSTLQLTLTAFAVTVLAVAANSQESSSRIPVLPATPAIHVMTPAPNFRVGDFRLETLDDDDPAPDDGPNTSTTTGHEQGLIKRIIIRIRQEPNFPFHR